MKEKWKERKEEVKGKALPGASKRWNKETPEEHPLPVSLSRAACSPSLPMFSCSNSTALLILPVVFFPLMGLLALGHAPLNPKLQSMSRKKVGEKGLILTLVARRTYCNNTSRVCTCNTMTVTEGKPQHNKGKIPPWPLRWRVKELQGKGQATKGK